MKKLSSMFLLILLLNGIIAQDKPKDKGTFTEHKAGYYQNTILKGINEYEASKKSEEKPLSFKMDFSTQKYPTSIELYKSCWHNAPLSQGISGTCWCFSATSFMESEVYRLSGKAVKLSEMYTVYWEYVERAKDFVKTRGKTSFTQGSESNAIPIIWKTYGIVPQSDYPGKTNAQPFHDHRKMVDEMTTYLQSIKTNNDWNEDKVVSTIKAILNNYMGEPPATINVDGKAITPKEYLTDVIKLKMNDYFSFMSTKEYNYYEKHELVEDDNWWHGDNYYNIPLDKYMELIKKTIEKGYSISICGDISEAGYDNNVEVGLIPSFDIPSEYIDDDARQFRFSNKSTTDDHCIHLIGYTIKDNKYWFLIKDSGSGGFDGENKGYSFYHEDYIKLKMMNILIHKDTAKEILDKIIK